MIAKRQAPHQPANLNRLSPAWMIGLLLCVVLYAFAQPWLNKHWGWKLPAISSAESRSPAPPSRESPSELPSRESPAELPPSDSSLPTAAAPMPPVAPPIESQPASVESFLQKIGEQTFRSPAGLVYKRGSAEGHRLKHLERHIRDIPDRPGSHGVFRGSMVEFLQIIDTGYTRAKNKEPGTSTETDEGRDVMNIRFSTEIGFLGGQDGKRKGNPPLKRLKIVLDKDSVITAYPF